MGKNISIAISAQDNFTQTINTMRNATSDFTKDLTDLNVKLDELNKTKITLQVDTGGMQAALKEVATYARGLSFTGSSNTTAAYGSNTSGSSGSNFVGNTLSVAGSVASLMSLASAAPGAAIAAIAVPEVAIAAIGAGIVDSLFNVMMESYNQKDDAFKAAVRERYDAVTQAENNSLNNGIGLAIAGDKSQTYAGMLNELNDLQNGMDEAMGTGYMDNRKDDLQEQIDYLKGPYGQKMKEAYEGMGKWQAELNGSYEASVREAQKDMMDSSDYKKADAATQYRMLQEASVNGMNQFYTGKDYQSQLQSEIALQENIKNMTGKKDTNWNSDYLMDQQFAKGLPSVQKNYTDMLYDNKFYSNRLYRGNASKEESYNSKDVPGSNGAKKGQNEGRAQTNYSTVTVTGNSFTIRQEADVEKVAKAIVRQMHSAYAVAG